MELSSLFLLLMLVGCAWSATHKTVRTPFESYLYINRYGYNICPNSSSSKKVACSMSYSSMLRKFQQGFGLKTTGTLDAATRRAMSLPHCGVADVRRAASDTYEWSRSSLTWSLRSYPSQIEKNASDRHEVCSTCSADIVLEFGRYDHGCEGGSFDGPSGTLAHAFFPEAGKIHFDTDEDWTENFDDSGFNFYLVALHEIGHALGMEHKMDRASIMFPSYELWPQDSVLPDIDRRSIKDLYGSKNNTENENNPTCNCRSGLCCSKEGLCGKSKEHCDEGCQAGPCWYRK